MRHSLLRGHDQSNERSLWAWPADSLWICHADGGGTPQLQQQYGMYIFKKHLYYVYILTNQATTVLYTGVTNNLARRLIEHWMSRGDSKTFAGRYNCYNLIYFEEFQYILNAIAREKQIKGWRKEKKLELIRTKNPDWVFLNAQFCGEWPPKDPPMRY